jgi:predicted nucleic acid-binding protein
VKLYFDAAYVAKFYLKEPDSQAVRHLAEKAKALYSSEWCLAEVACALHRQVREKVLTGREAAEIRKVFRDHVAAGVWVLTPVTRDLLEEVESAVHTLSSHTLLRAGDALHLVSARAAGFSEIWSNDRHLLRAARNFDLKGRSV